MRFVPQVILFPLLTGLVVLGSQSTSQPKPKVTTRCGPVKVIILKRVTPLYPLDARSKGIQGLVKISFILDEAGIPKELRVVSGPPELVSASLDAVKQWRYKPYRLNGKAVPVEAYVDVNYVIPVPAAKQH